jgi:putative ABC transport system ATP-binding protein
MNTIIETRDLHKTYHTNGVLVDALRGIDLTIYPGEFVAVMGPSGCGKSTLLHILGGLDRPTSGEIYIAGERIDTLAESKRAVLRRKTIGFVFQTYNLIPNLSVADNIDLPGLLLERSSSIIARQRNELLESLDITDKANAFPAELSGGEMQRVAIARALINHPNILLVDEPTGNLDTRSGSEVMELLRHFHLSGQTILLVTHDPKVAGYAGRVIFMRDGQFIEQIELTVPSNGSSILSRLVEMEL